MRKVFTAGMMLSVLVLAMGTGITGTEEKYSEIKTLFQPLDDEARAYLEAQPLSSTQDLDLNTFAVHLVEKYDENLSLIIDELENITGQPLLPERIGNFKLLIVREHLHRVFQESILESENATVLEGLEPKLVGFYNDRTDNYGVFYTPWGDDNPYPINYWMQVSVDIYGGQGEDDGGNDYNVNGYNGLYQVRAVKFGYGKSTYVRYDLYFQDEDMPDPTDDSNYDAWRKFWYGRIHDIEHLYVRTIYKGDLSQGDWITFEDIWDNNKTYAASGQHGHEHCRYTPDVTIYVSNVWNHAMDIDDTNPSMDKIQCNPSISSSVQGYGNPCEEYDSDGDGLTNGAETDGWTVEVRNCLCRVIETRHVTSDPYIVDTDGDGLTDYEERWGWDVTYKGNCPDVPPELVPIEYHVRSDPRNPDADSDGLNDLQEKTNGTDPNRSNTDCDGAWDTNDRFEVENDMNPLNIDTDDDGLTDGEEIDLWIGACGYSPENPENVPQEAIDTAVSNAKNPDVDGDGMTDGEEIAYWETLGLAPEEAIVFVGDLDMNQNGMIDSLEHFPSVIRRRGLHKGTENSLVSKVENAIKSLEKGNYNVAINQLQAFINEIEAQRGKKISEELAEMLIQYAQNVIWQIEDWKKR